MKTTTTGSFPKFEENQKEVRGGFAENLFRYIRHWKWFVFSMVVCLSLAVLYMMKASPVYEVKAKILLESTSENSNSSMNSLQDLGLFNVKNNSENELEVLNTSHLLELAVRKLGIYVNYYVKGDFKNVELYGADCPVSIRLPETVLDTLRGVHRFEVEVRPNGKYVFTGNYKKRAFRIMAMESDSQVVLPFGKMYFGPGMLKTARTMRVGVTLASPSMVADNLLSKMDIGLTSKTTTAISLMLKTNHSRKGIDLINAFLETYKEEDLKDKEMMSQKTSAYLENLLTSLGGELSGVEKQVESFKQREGLTDINSEAQLFIQRTSQYEQKRLEVGTQISIINDLQKYVNKDENQYQLLPSGIGIQSANLNSLIGEYNNLLLERRRLSRTATENNQVMIDLKDRIDALFKTVQSSINNEKRNLTMSHQDLEQKDKENAIRIKSIPRQEREISDLARQQNVKSQLYLFLLQKRDENYLSTASVTPKFKIISYPRSNGIPVAPKGGVIYFVAFVLGLFLPVFGISIRNMLHYTVENREELKLISMVPILGEIPKNNQSGYVIIHEHDTDGFTEMFRLLRTNLMFVLNEPQKKVINIVSSISGEGKTSITVNLAFSLALLDKKVLMLCLDIRKPKMNILLGLDNETGVTQYLSGQMPRSKLIRPSGIHPNLWVITSGPVPPNPNELLAKPALDELIDIYRGQFDYIVVDTPPIGAVSDSLLLNRFADVNLYIIRADYTPKNEILDANDIYNNQKLTNMYFVLNAANMNKSANYYHYGCRKKYGYDYGYGNYGMHRKKDKVQK